MQTRYQQLLVAAEKATSRTQAQLILSELNWIENWDMRYLRKPQDINRLT